MRQKELILDYGKRSANVFTLNLDGFNEMERHLKVAQKSAESLKDDIGSLSFNPAEPSDVRRAIVEMERLVDQRFSAYGNNPLVAAFVPGLKDAFRREILEQTHSAGWDPELPA